jgi:hypothetical protein
MDEPSVPESELPRGSLLAFVDSHWRELTLRDALSLTAELLPAEREESCIKETLTYS